MARSPVSCSAKCSRITLVTLNFIFLVSHDKTVLYRHNLVLLIKYFFVKHRVNFISALSIICTLSTVQLFNKVIDLDIELIKLFTVYIN